MCGAARFFVRYVLYVGCVPYKGYYTVAVQPEIARWKPTKLRLQHLQPLSSLAIEPFFAIEIPLP